MVREKLRDSFFSGLIIAAPALITVFILKVLFDWSLVLINPLVRSTGLAAFTGNIELAAQVVAAVFVIGFLTLLGIVSRTRRGSAMIGDFGRIAGIIPVFRTIYFVVRQVADGLTEKDSRFKKVVLVEFPREGVYSLGFITGEPPSEVEEKAGEGLYSVFIPNSPNPTGGAFRMFSEEEVQELDMSVRKALRLTMTTGITSDRSEI